MKYQQWNLRSQDPRDTGALMAAGFSPLCAAVLCARGLDDPGQAEAFLRGGAGELHDPFLLRDMDAAAARVARALEDGEAIAVYGDYDVDGITSTTLLTEFLRSRGGRVTAYIPDRIEEGYGLNREAEARLRSSGVTLIVNTPGSWAWTWSLPTTTAARGSCPGRRRWWTPAAPTAPTPLRSWRGWGWP